METETTPAGPHLALYRRWRAQTFGQIVGQTAVVTTLRNAVRLDRLSHGFLFVGPRGTGKTSMARILAKAVNCSDLREGEPCDACASCVAIREGRALDVVEMDAASNNRVDDMRELLPRVYTSASDLRRKVFIIDEVQRIKEGWDVLLKTLEEPPEGVLFVFCTTDPGQIRPAVVSRLQRFTFRPLSVDEISGKLGRILAAEGRAAEPEAIDLIARLAAGGMRDAESMLDQVLGGGDEALTADAIRDLLGMAEGRAVERFVTALASGDALTGLAILDETEAGGRDLTAFADQVVAALRTRLVISLSDVADRSGAASLARAARRLSGIDASRGSLGGYRWQLELALLAAASEGQGPDPPVRPTTAPEPATHRQPLPKARSTPQDRPTPAVKSTPKTRPTPAAEPEPPLVTQTMESIAEAEPTSPAIESMSTAQPALASASTRGADSDEMLARLRSGWPEVVAFVARNPANRPLIAVCRPVEVRDGVVVLGFPEDQMFLRDIAERKKAALEEGLRHVLGRSVGVRCVATNIALLEPVEPEAADLVEQARRIFEGDLADVRDIS
ncbi:MAG: DNA polymerase III subunit gamma/tau [Chloroflexota bacterium]|nr:DNA polymerase III subunit gamma/tau [Chloroflexota bacterium]